MPEVVASETREGKIELMVSDRDGAEDCVCCPEGQAHVFCYAYGLDGEPNRLSGRQSDAGDIANDVLREAFLKVGSADELNRHRIRVTVEILAPEAVA